MSQTGKELSAWSRLEKSRRPGWTGQGFALCAIAAVGAFAYFGFYLSGRGGSHLESTSKSWMIFAAAAHVLVFFRAPFRLYWHRDSKLLARLPLHGKDIFALSLRRGFKECVFIAIPTFTAALALAFDHNALASDLGGFQVAIRHVILGALLLVNTALLAPSIALFAGVAVANDKTQAAIASMGGEFAAPRNSLLGALPAVGATAMVLLIFAFGTWPIGGYAISPSVVPFVVLGIAVPAVSIFTALRIADSSMPAALREVSALDQERLAHVDKTMPSRLEALWIRLTSSETQAAIAAKDAAVSRRRFPLPYFILFVAILVLWGIAIANSASAFSYGIGILIFGTLYSALMAGRLRVPPIEYQRLVDSLPPGAKTFLSAKRKLAFLRIAVFLSVGGIPWAYSVQSPAAWFALPGLLLLYLAGSEMIAAGSQ